MTGDPMMRRFNLRAGGLSLLALAATVPLLAAAPAAAQQSPVPFDAQRGVFTFATGLERALPAVVQVTTLGQSEGPSSGDNEPRPVSSGSGAIIDAREDLRGLPRVIHGRSLGGGFAGELATRHLPKAAVLESTFTTLQDRAHDYGAPRFLLFDQLDVARFVSSFKGPLLLMHGVRDFIVPVTHGRALFKLAPHARFREFDAGHNDMSSASDYWQTLLSFLTESL